MGLDTKTYWLTDRQSQCDFDFDLKTVSSWDYLAFTGKAIRKGCGLTLKIEVNHENLSEDSQSPVRHLNLNTKQESYPPRRSWLLFIRNLKLGDRVPGPIHSGSLSLRDKTAFRLTGPGSVVKGGAPGTFTSHLHFPAPRFHALMT
jgi:hypothetical protein